jgi:hypothetical protein
LTSWNSALIECIHLIFSLLSKASGFDKVVNKIYGTLRQHCKISPEIVFLPINQADYAWIDGWKSKFQDYMLFTGWHCVTLEKFQCHVSPPYIFSRFLETFTPIIELLRLESTRRHALNALYSSNGALIAQWLALLTPKLPGSNPE